MASAVAKKEFGVVITSSPDCTPSASRPKCSAAVPLLSATQCLTPQKSANSRPKVGSNPRQKEIRLSGKSFRLASRSILESALISKELRHEQLDDGLHYDGAVPCEQSSFGPAKRDGKMRQVLRSAAVVAVFAFISVSVAKADGSPELFSSLTGPGGATASFYLPVNPV